MVTEPDPELRRISQGALIHADLLRDLLRSILAHDAMLDDVDELLHEHVAQGRYHPSVVAASLAPLIHDTLNAATHADSQHVDQLIADARRTENLDPDPATGHRGA